jgi:hypothetical protein
MHPTYSGDARFTELHPQDTFYFPAGLSLPRYRKGMAETHISFPL